MTRAVTSRSAILTYHSLDESGSVISVRPETFRQQMEALAAASVPVVPLKRIREHPGAVAITFDDGFANFAEYAVPVLQRLSFPATVFVVSGHCGRLNDWPGQPPEIPRLPLMSWRVLRDLPPAISLGAHTITHPDLRGLADRELARELREGRMEIEQETGRAADTFAFPYGAVDARTADAVRREFVMGCGTRLDFAGPAADPAALPRLDTYYLASAMWFSRLFGIPAMLYIALRRHLRDARAAAEGSAGRKYRNCA